MVAWRIAVALGLGLMTAPPLLLQAQSTPWSVDVYTAGADGYFAYRIPAIETAADGSLLAVAEARKYNLEDPGGPEQDIDLVLRRSTDQGRTWSPLVVIEDPGELWSAANPTTVVDRPSGRIGLFYLRCRPGRGSHTARPGTDDSQVLVRWSDDHGVTWSAPDDLTAVSRDLRDPAWRITVIGPGGGVQTATGRLVVPAWKFEPYRVFTLYSDDHGRSWARGELVPGDAGYDESQLATLADGRLLVEMRQSAGPHRWMAASADGGHSWSATWPGNRVSPVACALERLAADQAPDGRERLLWTGPRGPDRQTLVLRVSYDGGKTFQNERVIADEPAAYSDLTVLPDGSIGCLWERGGYRTITFTHFDLSFVEPR